MHIIHHIEEIKTYGAHGAPDYSYILIAYPKVDAKTE